MMSRRAGEYLKKSYFIFLNYLPLQIWTLKICICDISKTITARSFKLCQLIEDDEEIIIILKKVGENKKKSLYFRIISLCRFGL